MFLAKFMAQKFFHHVHHPSHRTLMLFFRAA
jgi:hypothetical protein